MYTLRLCLLTSLLLLSLFTSPAASLKIFEDSLSEPYKLFYHRTGDFGPSTYNVTGELEAMQPILGCHIEQYRNASGSYHQIYAGQVVLILRGNCTFSLKVFHAQQLGAVGVVVGDYNNTDNNDFIVMSKDNDGNEVHIPAVFVPHNTYQWLVNVLFDNATSTVYAMMDSDGEYVAPTSTIWLAAFGIVIVVIPTLWCFIVCLALLRKKIIHYVQGTRRRQHLTQIPIILYKGKQQPSLTVADVQTSKANSKAKAKKEQKEDLKAKLVHIDDAEDVPTLKEVSEGVEKGDGDSAGSSSTVQAISSMSRVSALLLRPFRGSRRCECAPHNSSCAICLDEFVAGEELRLLPCEHAYHRHCIDPWLAKQSELCPMCKQSIFMNSRREAQSKSLLMLCCCHVASFAWSGRNGNGDGNGGEENAQNGRDDDGAEERDREVVVMGSAQDELVRIDTDSEHSHSEEDENNDAQDEIARQAREAQMA